MIVVTGAAGFIGSCLVNKLNNKGFKDIVIVDDFSNAVKNLNIQNKTYRQRIDRGVLFEWLRENHYRVSFIFHMGARTDTAETNREVLNKLNLDYSKSLWNICTEFDIPLVYASSAATYGAGEHGYSDDHNLVEKLKPLNPYGESKNDFDQWVLSRPSAPYFWAGLKFFNVYGPNEYHKVRMASVVYHTYKRIKESGKMELFRSHHPDYKDGEQLRDFIYVKDVINICFFLMLHKKDPGLYNVGTGKTRSFLDLAKATFSALRLKPKITFIDTPEDIRENYQYYTRADISKLRSIGYTVPFFSLEDGIEDYVNGYLVASLHY